MEKKRLAESFSSNVRFAGDDADSDQKDSWEDVERYDSNGYQNEAERHTECQADRQPAEYAIGIDETVG